MSQTPFVNMQEDNELQKIVEQIRQHYYLFILALVGALAIVILVNSYLIPNYKISAAILIKKDPNQNSNFSDVISSKLFGSTQNLLNELEILRSTPILEQAARNLDLPVSYFTRERFQYREQYKNTPFRVLYRDDHVQPLNILFEVTFTSNNKFILKANSKEANLWHFNKNQLYSHKVDWKFEKSGRFNELIEASDLSLIIIPDSSNLHLLNNNKTYYFSFNCIPAIAEGLKAGIAFDPTNKDATIIQLSIKSESVDKGKDILNGIMDVYSKQDLDKKNHIASITIDYINKQLDVISDSLNMTEQKLQRFRSSNQVLDLTMQASGISQQYQLLQNHMAELITQKRYFDNVESNLDRNDDFSNIAIPSSLGIQDPELNRQVAQLITAQSQKSSLIENKQEMNPLVKKLTIEINNLKKVVSDNVTNARKTTEISIDEMKKRISKIEAQISRMPDTERQLVGIERKFRLNDAIFNYLMEKRSEANITKASNLPNNEIIEPAKLVGSNAVSPNKPLNYGIAILLGLLVPFGYLQVRSYMNNKVETQDNIERITNLPILGKIRHNNKKTSNVVFELPNSSISESYRALRTNMEYYVKGHKKVILITSCLEGEGKSFNALNIAMSYAQFGRKTILLDFDLRKPTNYFNHKREYLVGLSSYLIDKATIEDIVVNSPHDKLDYIPSGPIPPNPVELIGLDKTEKFINELKNIYDYIIIDTPPLAQVTDGYLLLNYAEVKVLIVRYNVTIKSVFARIVSDLRQKNVENVCIVMNDNRVYKDQYGYGYGYSKHG